MPPDTAKQPFNAKRRIQFLSGFSIFLIVAATAGWFYVAGKIEEVAVAVTEQQRLAGIEIVCENRDVRGYPFRFGLFCDSLAIALPDNSSVEAGSVRSAAQFYEPSRLIAELDGPAIIQKPDGNILRADWSALRASTILAEPLPESFSVFGSDVRLEQDSAPGVLLSDGLEGYMRVVGADLDLALRADRFTLVDVGQNLEALPPLGADLNIRVENGAARIAANQFEIRNTAGTLNRAAVLLSADQGLLISGPFSIDPDGLVDAQWVVRVIDVDAVSALVSKTFPQIASMISALAEGQPRSGEKSDEIELNISVEKSQIRMGFIPLGKLKPF